MLSLVICAVIFVVGYRQTGRPLKAMLCLVIGLGYTMGYTTLVVGHLNILTITFAPMLIGLAIDFGVHLVTRYEEELRHGRTEQDSMAQEPVAFISSWTVVPPASGAPLVQPCLTCSRGSSVAQHQVAAARCRHLCA